jgi:hypothetical protein
MICEMEIGSNTVNFLGYSGDSNRLYTERSNDFTK